MSPLARLRISRAALVAVAVCMLPLSPARASVPEYRLGDTAAADVITPVPLVVMNPEATEALKQRVAREVRLVVRHVPQMLEQAEAAMRDAIATVRRNFRANVQLADIESSSYERIVREIAATTPADFPFSRLAPLWLRAQPDDEAVNALVQPLRNVMAQPIVGNETDTPLPANETARLIAVPELSVSPSQAALESDGQEVASEKVLSLWRAKRLVQTSFPAGDEAVGRFVASFVQPNALPDPAATSLLRQKRVEGLAVNDTYEIGQVVVRSGQIIDRKALQALAALRERSMIGTLQSKLEQEKTRQEQAQVVAKQIKFQTGWIAGGLAAIGVVLAFILFRLRSRPGTALVPVSTKGGSTNGFGAADDANWRARALEAEVKAERAREALRSGVVGAMREKVVQTLSDQRAELLEAQRRAEADMRDLEARLEQLQAPLQERIAAYEKRIEELERELAAKGEENRELIGARIAVARYRLNMERERVRIKLR